MRERRLITYWSHLLHRGTSRYFSPTSAVPNKTRRKSHPAFYLVPNSPLWLLPTPIQIALKTFPRAHDLQMCRWVHYKRELEKAVAFYRSGGGSDGNRIPIGVAFMTTHSLASDRLEGRYATRVREYEDGFEPRLAMCRERVSIGLVASITLNRLPSVVSLLPLTFTLSRRHDLVSPWSEHRLQRLFFESRCTSGKPMQSTTHTRNWSKTDTPGTRGINVKSTTLHTYQTHTYVVHRTYTSYRAPINSDWYSRGIRSCMARWAFDLELNIQKLNRPL